MSSWKATTPSPESFMARAVELAYQGRGATAPNPCVGAVLVHEGRIVAEGWHKKCGGPHAERECLADARDRGIDPRGMTMYVTLEPCNHTGKTPPCTDALIEAGIAEVCIGTMDPNPVAAGGAQRLAANGIKVVPRVLQQECLDLTADFRLWQNTHSSFNILKMAATLDGKIASRFRRPEAVSCPESFARVQDLRSRVGAVVIGGGTFRADNPSLTCRLDALPEDFVQPLAVIVTTRLPEQPDKYTILRDRPQQAVFMTTQEAAHSKLADRLRQRGTSVWPLSGTSGCLRLAAGFERLRYDLGCYYTLIEGGGQLAMHSLSQGIADEVVHFTAPRILGDDQAPAAYSGRANVSMAEATNLRIIRVERSGTDMMLTMRPD
ncbi:bifunctional diaminohydroxyphosphoribosylaminopyrimidine deaminase/5-amino-6-(5-phosphoribosylamino)uracil reductase RibD [Pseudodesulfovibrio sp.]|uniref:bifunctional diaminohydroxyphosphoribosylaminopyrimidine deaminase/5-amino-6-(5-phosphoribosylamino)uracil reductase RibD n=1 Tax=unclassified Pseudodesulfovibrio TaxID=2661612 RepID=UPI003B00ED37